MRARALVALAAAALPLAALSAQTDPNQPANDGSAAASASVPPGQVAPGTDPGTAAANAAIAGNISAVKTVNANARTQYAADLAAYDASLRAHGRQVVQNARQRRAYAEAMAQWRMQVAACQDGRRPACDAPAPDPSAFY
ncbi:hypothetical protein [Sphingomonas morindae]|uniref:Uncharacterized protein n=1 Tax=Sphingomonas morindae TaxID=1541170 RepID=A0ABY4X833_9SPHN|nr:hypothetical protein [Sphingomonas morindae]USI72990.1 hypothetical protein LHA26_00475 [Sphingomonas morindae]